MKRELALFDFDGTITRGDSFTEFLVRAVGMKKMFTSLYKTVPLVALFKAGIISNDQAKRRVFSHFFKGWSEEYYNRLAKEFAQSFIPGFVRPEMMEKITAHRNRSADLLLVSASPDVYLRHWAEPLGFTVLGTKIEILGGHLTGNFATPNCYGPEKVTRIRQHLDISAYETIYAYGDSRGDREMLGLAHKKFFRGKEVDTIPV